MDPYEIVDKATGERALIVPEFFDQDTDAVVAEIMQAHQRLFVFNATYDLMQNTEPLYARTVVENAAAKFCRYWLRHANPIDVHTHAQGWLAFVNFARARGLIAYEPLNAPGSADRGVNDE